VKTLTEMKNRLSKALKFLISIFELHVPLCVPTLSARLEDQTVVLPNLKACRAALPTNPVRTQVDFPSDMFTNRSLGCEIPTRATTLSANNSRKAFFGTARFISQGKRLALGPSYSVLVTLRLAAP